MKILWLILLSLERDGQLCGGRQGEHRSGAHRDEDEPEARGGGAFFQQNPRSAHFVTQTP